MGKWFGGIITTLVLLALTSLIGALLKGPIDTLASGDRLTAQVQLSPWVPRPASGTAPIKKENRSKLAETLAEIQNNLQNRLAITSSSNFQFARIIVTNESNKTITDANIRFEEAIKPDLAVVVNEASETAVSASPDRIKLPNLKPGDKVGVFVWGNSLSTYEIANNFKTYSSAGRFRTSFDWPSNNENDYQSGLGTFINDWASYIFFGAIGLVTIFLAVFVIVQSSYVNALLTSERFTYSERERREKEGSKFAPDYTGAEKALKDTRG